jgi:hypothetical protein
MESSALPRREVVPLTASRHAMRFLMIGDLFLSNIGWFFFTAWGVVVGAVSLKAFGHELFQQKTSLAALPEASPTRPTQAPSSAPR